MKKDYNIYKKTAGEMISFFGGNEIVPVEFGSEAHEQMLEESAKRFLQKYENTRNKLIAG